MILVIRLMRRCIFAYRALYVAMHVFIIPVISCTSTRHWMWLLLVNRIAYRTPHSINGVSARIRSPFHQWRVHHYSNQPPFYRWRAEEDSRTRCRSSTLACFSRPSFSANLVPLLFRRRTIVERFRSEEFRKFPSRSSCLLARFFEEKEERSFRIF